VVLMRTRLLLLLLLSKRFVAN